MDENIMMMKEKNSCFVLPNDEKSRAMPGDYIKSPNTFLVS